MYIPGDEDHQNRKNKDYLDCFDVKAEAQKKFDSIQQIFSFEYQFLDLDFVVDALNRLFEQGRKEIERWIDIEEEMMFGGPIVWRPASGSSRTSYETMSVGRIIRNYLVNVYYILKNFMGEDTSGSEEGSLY